MKVSPKIYWKDEIDLVTVFLERIFVLAEG